MNTIVDSLKQTCKWTCLSTALGLSAACGGSNEPGPQPDARPPAEAGPDQRVSTREFVQLDAAGSRNIAGQASGIR